MHNLTVFLFALALVFSPKQMTAAQVSQAADQAPASLDYKTYRSSIEPIFLKKRENGVRCYDCHSSIPTRLRLQPLTPGSSSWSEDQSRRNFEAVSKLVTLCAPMKSRLLLHPLASEVGGDPSHTGGKFWKSQSDPEWQTLANWVGKCSGKTPEVPASSPSAETAALSFEIFKTQVQPIFLKHRAGHARCYGCHILEARNFRLQVLPSGSTEWTEEQSQRNFQSVLRQVVPGDPGASRLLLHPLAPEAGGDPFHSGGRQFESQNDPDWLTIAEWVRAGDAKATSKLPAEQETLPVQIYITNSASDTIDVVDPATNKVVKVIHGIELPHGIVFSPDGTRIYVSNESESVLDVVDRKSGDIVQKVPLSGHPNNLAVTKDGGRVLVGIREQPGLIDVIDTNSFKRLKSIAVSGSVHNIYVTPDGRYAVSGSIENKIVTVIDLQTDQIVWTLKFQSGIRPMTFETNADGSTRRIFVQLMRFNGFAVVDFARREQVAQIKLPDEPGGFGIAEGRSEVPSHGIGVAPDGKSLWINSTLANAVFEYSLPDLRLMGHAKLPEVHALGRAPSGSVPEWITFTPDSKRVYVSNSGDKSVTVIDAETLKEVAIIPVGEVPKRVNTLVLH
ncbi:MAG TPA: hypothetical protein VFE08_06400 [Candidatus Sulfotelmatobacter sp.]|nr:hypothetical protein [Candidatus Sulfotelmatobacter sp.]